MRVTWLAVVAVGAIVVVALTTTITRGPEFHHYADGRTWLGIPHAGDVVSNLAFLIVAAMPRSMVPYGTAVRAGVAWIGIGSAAYHVAPSDALLALDWLPIAITLALLSASVVRDRGGPGPAALVVGPLLAIAAVGYWIAGGGTHGGNMAPYVAVQLAGIALPAIAVLLAPGAICARWLWIGVIGFVVARLFGAYDRALLEAIGVSGHSMKHVAAAFAAACALRALMRR